jgi:PAS domain S-box-containing protein
MQAAGLGTWIWDVENNELYWDEDAYRMWGRRPNEFDKLTLQQSIEMTHPDDRAAIAASNDRFNRTGMPTPLEFRVLRPDNALQWLMTKSQIERDEKGKTKRVVGVYLDITERKRAEEARLNSQKMEALGTLAGGIAHDFNNILLAITGNAKLASTDLQTTLPPDHSVQRNLQEIEKAGTRAAELVKRILTFSRQQDASREVVSLQPLIEDALRLLRPTLRAAIEFHTSLNSNVAPVVSAPIQIQQVVMNLVTNAAHAIGDNPGAIEIGLCDVEFQDSTALATASLPAGRYVCLAIGDSGGGIDEAVIGRIFEPFFTTKKVGQGTGLGLAVVHGIVRTHGGAIGVETQSGRGTTIRVYFPASSGEVKKVEAKALESPTASGEHVMYVDDEEALVFLTARVLERLGYRVTGIVDPEQALRELRAHPRGFDVVVTDLSMRGMNGFELTRELHKIRPDLPVLLTSGYLRSEDRELAAKLGIRELILKPNTVEELGLAIDRTLAKLR